MAQLTVRKVDPALVRALKIRAARHGRSAEAEHREILRRALGGSVEARSFKDYLLAMPDDGHDEDLARSLDLPRDVDL
jgi:plasmid stability protein